MFSQVSVCLQGGLGLCPGGSLSREGLCPGGLCLGGLCLAGFLPRENLHPGCGCLSRGGGGVSVQGGFCLGALWQGLCPGGLCPGKFSVQGVGLCPGCGSLSRGVSVQGGHCPGGSGGPRGSLGGLCPRGVFVGGGRPPYGNVRAVRILLECILVQVYFWCII